MAKQATADIGLVGLAVMGENLVLNIESRGFTVAVFNRTQARVSEFLESRGKGKRFVGCSSVEAFCAALIPPRKVFIMVKAGPPVDAVIESVLPHLEKGDIVIDGGNSHYMDTERRVKSLEARGLLFVGCGVSGGEEGALNGPALMPGGSAGAWSSVQPILQAISAQVPDSAGPGFCCNWVGPGGSGHYVKMVHNGIEYGDMQLLSEAYALLRSRAGLSNLEAARVVSSWNESPDLSSYLVEIVASILARSEILDSILDCADQKGTGKWTGQDALDRGVAVSMIAEAVFARCVSALKIERVAAAKKLAGPQPPVAGQAAVVAGEREARIREVEDAVACAKMVSYAQGFELIRAASNQMSWKLRFGEIAAGWRGGCIIRSKLLDAIRQAFSEDAGLCTLLVSPYFSSRLAARQAGWRQAVIGAVGAGVSVPAMSSALAYYDAYRTERLPANLIQAMRDYFGAHTYERVDKPRGEYFHTNWTGHGGTTTSTPPSH